MSTFSWNKNPIILADKYAKDFRSYESYMKHCVNILKNINWLKNNNENAEIPDYQYIQKIFNTFGIGFFDMVGIFNNYNKNILPNIPLENIQLIQTNAFYLNTIEKFLHGLSNVNGDSGNIITDGMKAIQNKHDDKYKQLYYRVLSTDFAVDKEKLYSEDEIINLIIAGKIIIVDSFAQGSFTMQDIKSINNNGQVQLFDSDFYGGLVGFNGSGEITGYFEALSKEDKEKWFIKNMLPLKFLRKDNISFKIGDEGNKGFSGFRTDKYFNNVFEHINSLSVLVEKNFKKRKKYMPNNYQQLHFKVKDDALKEKQSFERNCVKLDNEVNLIEN